MSAFVRTTDSSPTSGHVREVARSGSEAHIEQRDAYLSRAETESVVRICPPTEIGGVWNIVANPAVIVVGANKSGVDKTTVSRTVLDYFSANKVPTRAFDTESPTVRYCAAASRVSFLPPPTSVFLLRTPSVSRGDTRALSAGRCSSPSCAFPPKIKNKS